MFQPSLDPSFLKQIAPLKTPPTMLTGAYSTINPQNNGNVSNQTNVRFAYFLNGFSFLSTFSF